MTHFERSALKALSIVCVAGLVGCVDGRLLLDGAEEDLPGGGFVDQGDAPQAGAEGSACSAVLDCKGELECVLGPQGAFCLKPCALDGECASQDCRLIAGTEFGYCELGEVPPTPQGPGDPTPDPEPGPTPSPDAVPQLADDGAACLGDAECKGGTCLRDASGFPSGYCTTQGCERSTDCSSRNAACLNGQPNYCVQLCQQPRDCRTGYECREVNGGAYCAPLPQQDPQDPPPDNNDPAVVFDTDCGGTFVQNNAFQGYDRHELSFNIPQGTTSYMVVPYAQNNGQIFSVQLDGPGGRLDMFGNYDFANANAGFLINLVPTLVPAAPQFEDFVAAGDHTLTMGANTDLCRVVHTKRGNGSRIDLNFYFVGVNGLNAGSAGNNNPFQQALGRFEAIYGQHGVSVGQVRYSDVSGQNANAYRIIRDDSEVFDLVSLSRAPGSTSDEALSVNVFFIDQFAIQGGSVLGISAGLPGAAGIHGTRGSGLVFSATVMNDANLLGQVLAHEVGHFLGLFHTSEQGGQGYDPIGDTAQCSANQWNNPNACPDINNLMFPFAGNNHTTISQGQASVLQANPLIK